jgi:hypothetical protein
MGRPEYLWVLALVLQTACGNDHEIPDPGRVTLHRLNNTEYNNTVRDLLGTNLRPADEFPSDDRGYGFDNVADSLTLSPLQVELYDHAAEALIKDVFETAIPSERQRGEIETIGTGNGGPDGDGWLFYSNATISVPFKVTTAGTYRIAARAGEQAAGPDNAHMTLRVSGGQVYDFAITAPRAMPAVYQQDVVLPVGDQTLQVAFTNDYALNGADRNLWVDYAEVVGPIGATVADTSKRDRILICDPATGSACVENILRAFVRRAWRRPPTPDEISRLVDLAKVATDAGDDILVGIQLALRGALVSPSFLFRVEIDREPSTLMPYPLSSYELASRLSYFLWSSMPDDELLALADTGKLAGSTELLRQAERMLADPRAVALTDNFAGQWLFTRALGDHVPDDATYPLYDAQLEAAMRAETQRYFRAFLEEDIPMDQFLVGDFTYVNDRLAQHYGLPLPGSNQLVKTSLVGTNRLGLLTQGSILTVTSHPRRTSPVKRGKWLLDQILCEPPPPPPPGVEGLLETGGMVTGSVRQRLEAHRDIEYCASCHSKIDPLGFGLEHYDGIGSWRTMDDIYPVDASGVLPDGQTFYGAGELAKILAGDPRVYRCMVEKLYTYALGRPPISIDAKEHIDQLTEDFTKHGYLLRDLVMSIVTHTSFRDRRGEP